MLAERELELTRAQAEFQSIRARIEMKEQQLAKYSSFINESELAYSKLQLNTDRLATALTQESTNLQT
jgi:hypothetical protein